MAQWLSWLERRPVTAEVAGSSPVGVAWSRTRFLRVFLTLHGSVAQLVERTTENREVSGSIPLGATAHERALAYAGPFHFCFISSWYILRQLLTQNPMINAAAGAGTVPWHTSDSNLLVVKHADTKTGIAEKCGIVFCICVFYHQGLQTIIYTHIFHHKQ